MKKVKQKKQIAVAAAVGICLILGGCTGFDSAGYVQAVLDASYKNKTEEYIEITGMEKEKAETVFQESLDAVMKEFKSEKLSAELEEDYRSLFETVIKQVKYTVGEAEKEKDGSYKVEVAVKPITLFDDTYQIFQTRAEEYAGEITDSVMNGAELPTDDEIQEQVYQLYYEILRAELDAGVKYGKAEKITLHIRKTEEGDYEISRKNLQELDGKMISRKVMAEVGEEETK